MALNEKQTKFLTGIKVAKAFHCFEKRVAMRTKTINTEAVIFLLSDCCLVVLGFAIWSCSLEREHDHIFKTMGLVLSRCEYMNILVCGQRSDRV